MNSVFNRELRLVGEARVSFRVVQNSAAPGYNRVFSAEIGK
jgi:hypothetical protein